MLESDRKIADKAHNRFLEEQPEHQATQAAPRSLLQLFDDNQKERIANRYAAIETTLRKHLGEPFFAESGFVLTLEIVLSFSTS